MKRSLLLLALAVAGTGCDAQVGLLTIDQFYPLENGCDVNTERFLVRGGSLDVGSNRAQYYTGFRVLQPVAPTQQGVEVGQTVLVPDDSDYTEINQLRTRYRLFDRAGQDITPLALRGRVFTTAIATRRLTEGTEELFMPAGLMVPLAVSEVANAMNVSLQPEDFNELIISVQVAGRQGRSGQVVLSNEAQYPISVYRSDLGSCAVGEGPKGACLYVGQGGAFQAPDKPICCDTVGAIPGCR